MKRLTWMTIITALLAIVVFLSKHGGTTIPASTEPVIPRSWLTENYHSLTPDSLRRPADQTLLTFPEWFLVFSPEEQANYFEKHTATSFPFIAHTAQIWDSYGLVKQQLQGAFPPNNGYHFMIWVIGSSASVEYVMKAWYEKAVGRLTDIPSPSTDEDRFNAVFTREYVDFIKVRPWYEFDFSSRLKRLWSESDFWGRHWIRKMERRYWLSSELVVKAAYGKLIGLGTQQIYEVAAPTTAVILADDSLRLLPRYDGFMKAATELSAEGGAFKEIAGNRTAILVSVIVNGQTIPPAANVKTVFSQPIVSDPGHTRVVLATPVSGLAPLLSSLQRQRISLEHVFDY